MIPFLDDDTLFHLADDFLKVNHPSLSLPVPIESIIELKMGLSIFPIKNLNSGCDTRGSLASDFKTILIDEREWDKFECASRFTFAHEVGHYVLHKDLYTQLNGYKDIKEFVDFQNNLNYADYRRLEIQASFFAENLLFPKAALKEVIEDEVRRLGGISALVISDIEKVITKVSEVFEVTDKAAFNKVRRDYRSLIEVVESNIPF